MVHRRVIVPFILVLALLSACTPGARTGPPGAPATPADPGPLQALERTAWEAWHLMELGRLRGGGVYTTNALVDLPLPQGVRWTILEFADTSYVLSVTSDDGEGAFVVDPSGVRAGG